MKKKYLLFILFVLIGMNARAFHIAGGDLTTRWISGNTFEVTLTLYRDCSNASGAQYDQTIILGIYDKATDLLQDSLVMTLDNSSINPILLSGSGCIPPPSVCMESGNYISTVTLADNPAGYYFVWERCCRNIVINNISNPQSAGMAFYEEIADPTLHNSSPAFNSPPAPFTCATQFFQFSFNATDADGDSLVYELTDPLDGGHTFNSDPNPFSDPAFGTAPPSKPYIPITWENGYELTNICGSALPLVINSETGLVEGTPDAPGIYAMAVTVYEYRNGVLIGEVRREIEFTAIPCTDNNAPNISPSISDKDYNIYVTDTLCFTIDATDINGDSLFMTHTGEVFENTAQTTITAPFATSIDTIGVATINSYFCWIPSCDQARDSAYFVNYQIRDNGCPLPLIVNGRFRIQVNPMPVVDKPNLLCLHFNDSNIIKIAKAPAEVINVKYFKGFQLYRSVNSGPYVAIKLFSDPLTTVFYDSTAFDNTRNNYCYFIAGVNNCGTESDHSDTLCSDHAFNFNKNYIETVTVENNSTVKMKWEPFPDGFYSVYYVYRKNNSPDSSFEKVMDLKNYASFEWTDTSVKVSENSYCYHLVNEDVCGNLSVESDNACTILLNGEAEYFVNKLNWNNYVNWQGSVGSYNTERNDENINVPYRKVEIIPFADSIAEDRNLAYSGGVYNYRIRAVEGFGGRNAESLSNEIELIQAPALYVPNAFSPNSDSKNEFWGAESVFVKTFEILLYNRWGQMIFHTNSTQDKWDGLYNGKEVPQDVYFYKLQFSGYNSNKIFEKTGSVTVVR